MIVSRRVRLKTEVRCAATQTQAIVFCIYFVWNCERYRT